ncbi:MAG: acyl-CoA dehydrogenase family protein [Candidatus Cloacimonetes bacterium]|nr:acyl-CoA dehydrogenase family protein [Candidatus Cloacimonadota bacterium]
MSLINLNNEQKMIRDEFRKFATSELEPIAENIEENGVFPKDIISKLSELGLLSLIIPEKYGGVELDVTSLCIAVEEISKVCASIGTILVVNNCMVAYPLMKYGDESFKEKYLNKLSNGEIGGFVCEPEIDLPEEKNDLKAEGNKFIFSGHREFVLNGDSANFFIMLVSTPENTKYYVIDKDIKGIHLTSKNILGLRSAGFAGAEFKDIKLTKEACFIAEDKGGKILSEIQDYANIGFSAISLGIAQAALEPAVKYSKERVQFGHRICEFPMVQEMMSEIKMKIETARLLVYDAASKVDKGEDFGIASKITRHYCGELGVFAGLNSIQVHGGYGYMKDYPLERYFRDAKVLQLLETSPRISKSQIAKELLK